MTLRLLAAAGLLAAGPARVAAAEAPRPTLPFDSMPLIEAIDCGEPPDSATFKEFPEEVSQVETILGKKARVLPNPKGAGVRYFAYLVGKGKNLQGGKAYVLEVDFADNAPRTFFIRNGGEAITRGVFTGTDAGDALHPLYVNANAESLNIPLSHRWDTWFSLFFLHDKYYGLGGWPRGDKNAQPEMAPKDGFWVVVGQLEHKQAPLSQGAAISAIRLYEAPPPDAYTARINFPAPGLPRRHLFWREEMSDSAVSGKRRDAWQTTDRIDWYENKAKRMKFLGMDAYAIDLLEFGSNQGWDSGPGGGNEWYYQTSYPDSWERILGVIEKYGLLALPYYEYHGSIGQKGLGNQKRAKPLNEKLETYTHIKWAEKARANILDPDTEKDLQKLLDLTIVKFKDKADFLGAWLRPRNSGIPISFADSDIELFSREANNGQTATRKELQTDKELYQKYIDWWFTRRRDFLVKMQDYLAEQGMGQDIKILYTTDPSEPGFDYTKNLPPLVAEDAALWAKAGEKSMTPEEAVQRERHRKALLEPSSTWGEWEWQHSVPRNDPQNYKNVEDVALTYTFNRLYTVNDAKLLEDFTGKEGLAMVRHFSLNENMMSIDKKPTVGYFVADFERIGPYSMMAEAVAMAKGNPYYIGYLSGERFSPGFPQYARAFNQAFLALPALPAKTLPQASSDQDVVVREILTPQDGTYYAVVNTARTDKEVTLKLPTAGAVTDAAENKPLADAASELKLSMYPFQLRALLVK